MTTSLTFTQHVIQGDIGIAGMDARDPLKPERTLCAGVLLLAVDDFLSNRLDDPWFFDDEGREPFSFRWLCEQISDDGDELAGRLLRYLASKPGRVRFRGRELFRLREPVGYKKYYKKYVPPLAINSELTL